jgi:RNA polymerase sigma-70 factor (ECF subfamily)
MQVYEPVTKALQDFANGDASALDRVMPLLYNELRRVAGSYLRHERDGHTLQPTALVHEAYFRLIGDHQPEFQNRAHFLGVAAQAMRQILVDHARTRNAGKRGGGQATFSLDECRDTPITRSEVLIRVDDALQTLAALEPHKAQLIEMRFFGGMTAEEVRGSIAVAGAKGPRPVADRPGLVEARVGQPLLRKLLNATWAAYRPEPRPA